jgi:hypothetical protein
MITLLGFIFKLHNQQCVQVTDSPGPMEAVREFGAHKSTIPQQSQQGSSEERLLLCNSRLLLCLFLNDSVEHGFDVGNVRGMLVV